VLDLNVQINIFCTRYVLRHSQYEGSTPPMGNGVLHAMAAVALLLIIAISLCRAKIWVGSDPGSLTAFWILDLNIFLVYAVVGTERPDRTDGLTDGDFASRSCTYNCTMVQVDLPVGTQHVRAKARSYPEFVLSFCT
jgi:hypothetical protein